MGSLDVSFSKFIATKPKIILGSSSRSRRGIMDSLAQRFNFSYHIQAANIDEKQIRRDKPEDLVMALSHAKAKAILDKLAVEGENLSEGFLITCDQVVVHDSKILEKPQCFEEFQSACQGYSKSPASTVGAIVCTNLSSGLVVEALDIAEVHMAELPASVIDALSAEGLVYETAGGIMIEHPLIAPYITRIVGTEDSIMGLSKAIVMDLLLKAANII